MAGKPLDKETKFKTLFKLSSIVTDFSPRVGGRFLDVTFRNILGNKILLNSIARSTKRMIRGTEKFGSFLFVGDLNIGDAVISSAAVAGLREIFPDAEIDFVIKKSAGNFVEGNPDVSNLFPIFEGAPFPTADDLVHLSHLAEKKEYDLVINFSPMIDDKIFSGKEVVNYKMMAAQLVRNESLPESVNNISFQSYNFAKNMFRDFLPSINEKKFGGTRIYLSDEAISNAESYLAGLDIAGDHPLILFNPDASSRFTRVPFDTQRSLLERLSSLQSHILLSTGYVERDIEHELMYSLSPEARRSISILPSPMSLDVFAALIDLVSLYVGGDTGPLHLAASRKFVRNSGESLRNKTAVFSIFGATPPRIYGYDSETPGFFPANQDAPSRTFVAPSPCRNITCINKTAKTCREVRCFDNLNTDRIISEAGRHLESVRSLHSQEVFSSSKIIWT
jgi:ADP-heptose:LPS heptosyltransferase